MSARAIVGEIDPARLDHRPNIPGKQAAARRLSELLGTTVNRNYIHTRTLSGRLAAYRIGNRNHYSEADLYACVMAERSVATNPATAEEDR